MYAWIWRLNKICSPPSQYLCPDMNKRWTSIGHEDRNLWTSPDFLPFLVLHWTFQFAVTKTRLERCYPYENTVSTCVLCIFWILNAPGWYKNKYAMEAFPSVSAAESNRGHKTDRRGREVSAPDSYTGRDGHKFQPQRSAIVTDVLWFSSVSPEKCRDNAFN